MAQFFEIHPQNPNARLVRQTVDIIRQGGVVAYPTDSGFALGCQLGDAKAVERIRRIRELDNKHNFTLMCRDLSEISTYAQMNNATFRLLKNNTPGSYTFILDATREVPRRLMHPKRKTIGIRVPDHSVALALLEELAEPLLSTTLILPDHDWTLTDAEEIGELLDKQVDLVVEGGPVGLEYTTVIDLTSNSPQLVRQGLGDASVFGLD